MEDDATVDFCEVHLAKIFASGRTAPVTSEIVVSFTSPFTCTLPVIFSMVIEPLRRSALTLPLISDAVISP